MVNVKLDFDGLQEDEKNGLYATIVENGKDCSVARTLLQTKVESYDTGRALVTIHTTRSDFHPGDVLLSKGLVFGSEHTDVANIINRLGLEKYVVEDGE